MLHVNSLRKDHKDHQVPRNASKCYRIYYYMRSFWLRHLQHRPLYVKVLVFAVIAMTLHETLNLYRFLFHAKQSIQTQSYFHSMQCERIPKWFLDKMEAKRKIDPTYAPTLAFMTTTANRLWSKHRMVMNAVNTMNQEQTDRPDAVFIVLPEYSLVDRKSYRIPDNVPPENLIKSCRDYGPGTKFIAPLRTFGKAFRNAFMISFDDDMTYDPKTIEVFKQYAADPAFNRSAIAARGNIPDAESFKISKPVKVVYPLAVYAMMYFPRHFDLDHVIWSEKLRPDFYREDDCWFGCLAQANSFDIWVVPGLRPLVVDGCPLGQCLHYNMDIKPSINHLTKKDTCKPEQRRNWVDEYYPEASRIMNNIGGYD